MNGEQRRRGAPIGLCRIAAGLDFTCRETAARSVRPNLRQADADEFPFADESFDYVLS
jgi:hypothetical protein